MILYAWNLQKKWYKKFIQLFRGTSQSILLLVKILKTRWKTLKRNIRNNSCRIHLSLTIKLRGTVRLLKTDFKCFKMTLIKYYRLLVLRNKYRKLLFSLQKRCSINQIILVNEWLHLRMRQQKYCIKVRLKLKIYTDPQKRGLSPL